MQVGLLNVDGYYNLLLALFDNSVAEGFIHPTARNIVVSASTAKELMVKMEVSMNHIQHNIQLCMLSDSSLFRHNILQLTLFSLLTLSCHVVCKVNVFCFFSLFYTLYLCIHIEFAAIYSIS